MSHYQHQRLVDYFAVCGLDERLGLEPEAFHGDSVSVCPFEQRYKPSVLFHAPKDVTSNPFDDNGVKMLCFPRGISLKINERPDWGFHSFLLTKEDGSRFYGCALTFYERVHCEQVSAAMYTLVTMYNAEQETLRQSKDRAARLGQDGSYVASLDGSYKNHVAKDFSRYDPSQDTLYCSKCICLIMQKPFVTAAKSFLRELLQIGHNEIDMALHTESYVYNILYEVPVPPPGRTLRFSCGGASITTQQPNVDELPLFDYSMKELFLTLGIENVVDLYTCLLLEHQILIVGSDLSKFMMISEALTALLFPLLWQHVYVPILPSNLLHFLDAPVPFLMGVYCQTEADRENMEIPCEASLCLYDVDDNRIELPAEIPELPCREDLIKELADVLSKFGVDPPKGCVLLRPNNALKRDDGSYDGNSSFESLNSDLEGSYEKRERVPPNRSSSFKGQRRIRGRMSTEEQRPVVRRHRSHSSSPSMRRKADSSDSISYKMQTRKLTALDAKPSTRNGDTGNSPSNENNSSKTMPNPRLAAMMALAQKAGIDPSSVKMKDKISTANSSTSVSRENLFIYSERAQQITRKVQHENELNIVIRDIFLNRFTQMLVEYESFVIIPKQDKEQWISNREHIQNFDKAAFLSDQSTSSLPFMTLFVETQGFATLIDMKILASWEDTNPRLSFFDKKRDLLKVRLGIIRSHIYERCSYFPKSIEAFVNRSNHIDHTAQAPHALKPMPQREKTRDCFPNLQINVLNMAGPSGKKIGKVNWKKRDKKQQQQEHILLNRAIKASQEGQKIKEKLAERVKKYMQDSRLLVSDGSMAGGGQQTLPAFADRLLKECKMKTKRLVVLKLGEEALELGHNENSTAGIEENTLIASLCDLLERVWSHGVQLKQLEIGNKGSVKSKYVLRMRQSKSALWSHLLAFQQRELIRLSREFGLEDSTTIEGDVKKILKDTQACRSNLDIMVEVGRTRRTVSPEPMMSQSQRIRQHNVDPIVYRGGAGGGGRQQSFDSPTNSNLDAVMSAEVQTRVEFLDDLRTVQNMKEIKTDTGYARAWTRLSLERKILSRHLKMLLKDRDLLETRYKDYAFIRTEEEMEQFLYHLLSLNAVDFHCFTYGFSNTLMCYRVTIVSTKTIGSLTTANCWLQISGDLAGTDVIPIPKGDREFTFKHSNLGILSTVRIGHDNSGLSAGWFVDYLLIQNESTGIQYRFPCDRWLSRNQDDGSTERLLIAELIRIAPPDDGRISRSAESSPCSTLTRTTPNHRKKSIVNIKKVFTISEIQELVADSVNALVKYFYREKETQESFTYLLRGEGGFCQCMEVVFSYGFKSSRLFGRNIFLWDFIEKVSSEFAVEKDPPQAPSSSELKMAKRSLRTLVQKINTSPQSIGKDEKFNLWLCLGLREHLLQCWLHVLSTSKTASQMYEKASFLLSPDLTLFLHNVLEALLDFEIILETSITRGLTPY
eukprot:gene12905-14235_t